MAKITVNGETVVVEQNENDHFRGLHIVIINPKNGKIELASVFDTYESSDVLDGFIGKAKMDGFIIVAACKDECVRHLSFAVKKWF